jgi:tetratricopeptide (TPR) repeat protein
MAALWCSRRGLAETELLDMLGDERGPMPGAYWWPLALAAESFLAVHAGSVSLQHQTLRAAVERRYLSTPTLQRACHQRLARYFATLGLSRRANDERSWHLAHAEDWDGLAALLMDSGFLQAVAGYDESDRFMAAGAIVGYWSAIEANSPLRYRDALQPVLQDLESASDELYIHAAMLAAKGLTGDALRVTRALAARYRSGARRRELMQALTMLSNIEFSRGELDAALKTVEEWDAIAGELGDNAQRHKARIARAMLLVPLHRSDEADDILKESGKGALAGQDLHLMFNYYGALALIHLARGSELEREACIDEQIRLARETGNALFLAQALMNRGAASLERRNAQDGLRWTNEAEALCRTVGLSLTLATVLQNKAVCLMAGDECAYPIEEDIPGAVRAIDEAEAILRSADNPRDLSIFCVDMARLVNFAGQQDRALRMLEEGAMRARALGDRPQVARAHTWRSEMLLESGRKEEAWPLLVEAKAIIMESPERGAWLDAGPMAQSLIAEHYPDEDNTWE